MTNKKIEKDLEKEYEELEKLLQEELNSDEVVDSLSDRNCIQCGARLTKLEVEDFTDTCGDCIFVDTAGTIDDDGEELQFDDS